MTIHRPTGEAASTRSRPRRRLRRWTPKRRALFIETLAESCNVSAAARAAGMERASAYYLKDHDPAFAQAWGAALERAHGALEWHLLQLAQEGTVRTELTLDSATGATKLVKLIHSHPLTMAVRLFLAHRAEVATIRAAQKDQETEADVSMRVLGRMDEARARLLAPIAADIWGEAETDGRKALDEAQTGSDEQTAGEAPARGEEHG